MQNGIKHVRRGITLALLVGVLPFFFIAGAQAQETETPAESAPVKKDAAYYFDEYKQPVGLMYAVEASINTAYMWRGISVGGLNIQPYAKVGYGGLYVDMWWNIGATDWYFRQFLPELDLQIGFNRWGINASVMFIHNFNCRFFDFSNHPDGGNALEARLRYTVSSKLPLSFLWATRIGASDGYLNAAGDTIRAYSSYAEISYTQALPYGLSLYGAIGITPWKSFYTGYQGDFAVQNIEIRLRKDWTASERCGLMIQGVLSINPTALANDPTTAHWTPADVSRQSINANLAFGFYLK